MMPSSSRRSGLKVSPSSLSSRPRFTIAYCFLKMLVKPRLGRRRCSGIWPPSKPRFWLKPVPACCPLCPRADVFPCPEPMPRPTRLRSFFCPAGGFKLLRFIRSPSGAGIRDSGFGIREHTPLRGESPLPESRIPNPASLSHNLQQMRNLLHHPAENGRVGPLDHLVELAQPKTLD